MTDHLSSASVIANADGTLLSEVKYTAFGEIRSGSGDMATKYQYTGQLSQMAEIGLYHYGARFYDPVISHFVSADSIVPSAGNVRDFNRYAYVRYNPLAYVDPSGNFCVNVGSQEICSDDPDSNGWSSSSTLPKKYTYQPRTVTLGNGAEGLKSLYKDFAGMDGWWKNVPGDPLFLFAGIILSREAYPAYERDGWFSGAADDPARIFSETVVRWFWSWVQDEKVIGIYGSIKNDADREAMFFNFLYAGMASSRKITIQHLVDYGKYWTSEFTGIAEQIFTTTNPAWTSGDGMWAWGNGTLYREDMLKEALEVASGIALYQFGSGASTFFIFDTAGLRIMEKYKKDSH